jgi:mono/diheme cytochrome c family protein
MPLRRKNVLLAVLACGCVFCTGAAAQEDARNGEADARIFSGFKRYHAGCNHCHGPEGMGSTVAPPLIDRLPDLEAFRRIVRNGISNGSSVMQGFADDPNVAPYVDDIFAYLHARAEGKLGRGRPVKQGQ